MTDLRKLLRECRDYVTAVHDHRIVITNGIMVSEPCPRCTLRDSIDAFLSQPAASAEDVRVDEQGVRFGQWVWVSHDKIAGEHWKTSHSVIQKQYRDWVSSMLAAKEDK